MKRCGLAIDGGNPCVVERPESYFHGSSEFGCEEIEAVAAVLACNAVPVIAEIDPSLTIDAEDVEAKISPRTRAIIPVHMRGTPCRVDRVLAVARRRGLKVLEDCAQANGGKFRGRPLGSFGDAGGFSFQQSKKVAV